MEAYSITVTAVERDGERWIVLPGGNAVRIGEQVAVPNFEAMAVITDICDLRDRQVLMSRWSVAMASAVRHVRGVVNNPVKKLDTKRQQWSRRVNSCAVVVRQMVRRGSNLKEEEDASGSDLGSWEQVIQSALLQCNGTVRGRCVTDRWGMHCINLASNIRKRFRRFVPPDIPAFARRRRTKRKRVASNSR